MSFDLPVAERKLKSTERFVHQSMWLLFLVAAVLMVIVGRSAPARIGSVWMLGCAGLAFMLSYALRDVVRKLVRRNTEDQIVKDVKTFLEGQPVAPAERPAPVKVEVKSTATSETVLPAKSAGFVPLKDATAYRTPAGDPVVYDTIPLHDSAAVRMNFYAVLMPVVHTC
jgi:hypothetical protein